MEKYAENRPWGSFERFCQNEKCTVKIITVNAGEAISLQYHKNRSEFWRILKGPAQLVIGEKTIEAGEDDEFFISNGQKHRIIAKQKPVQILEIAFGSFDENDIVRLDDKYKRK